MLKKSLNLLLLAASLTITACASTSGTFIPTEIETGFKVFYYDVAGAIKYKTIGLVTQHKYSPGFSDPKINDVLPELVKAAKEKGGDGLIIRTIKNPDGWRYIDVTAEVIKIE